MNRPQPAGFEEIPHTADWALHVWAPDLPGLFVESAKGMYAMMGVHADAGLGEPRSFQSEAPDPESLLVAFLSELVFVAERERLVFNRFSVAIEGNRLQAGMFARPLRSLSKAIKAVTYHNLKIRRTERGYEAEIVFDV